MQRFRRFSWSLVIATLPLTGAGCSNSSSAASSKACTSDEAIACITDSGCHGYKHCNSDGSGYGPCDCSLSDPFTIPQAGAASFSPGAGGSVVAQGGAFLGAGGSNLSVGGSTTTLSQPGTGGTSVNVTTSVSSNAGQGGASPSVAGTTSVAGATSVACSTSRGATSGLVFRRAKQCDENGICRCINLASFGARAANSSGTGSDGKPSSTTDFEAWLTEKTNANVTMVVDKPNLSVDYLANFDVILLQDLRKWVFLPEELQNLACWVEGGGGLIALSGYMNNDDAEVTASNQVLAFSGMSYNGGATAGSLPQGDCPAISKQLCPQATTACCYCWNNVVPILDLHATHAVTRDVHAIGAYNGRSINASDATVLATFSPSSTTAAKTVAAVKSVGLGQVLLWCDEWITYTSQWSGGQVDRNASGEQLRYASCYDSSAEHWLTADHVFQTKQFWYNLISYVAPPTECKFVVEEPEEVKLSQAKP